MSESGTFIITGVKFPLLENKIFFNTSEGVKTVLKSDIRKGQVTIENAGADERSRLVIRDDGSAHITLGGNVYNILKESFG